MTNLVNLNLDRLWPPKFKVGDIVRLRLHHNCPLSSFRGKVKEVRNHNCYYIEWESQGHGKEDWPATVETEDDLEKVN